MVQETIFQHWILTQFILPFLLIWIIVFAILRKTKLLGENQQIDSLVAFVIGFIFISFLQPKEIVSNLILFLTMALILMFIGLLLWGFISGKEMKENILSATWAKWVAGIVIVIAVIIAFIWASGLDSSLIDLLFDQSWSDAFWTNISFIVVVAIALALVLRNKGE
jgi:H+/Cl- antiporter ClcA